jgi:oxalate oxidoreductase subunit delta
MAKMFEITIWSRGVIIDKEARDISLGIALAAEKEGKYVQAIENYEDLPDRVLVTVRKYTRISDEEIEHKYIYHVEYPDVVVVVEPTIVKGIDVLRGIKEGGLLIVNTNRPVDYILKFIPNANLLGAIATIDAESISGVKTVDFSGTEGGVEALGIGIGVSAPIMGAIAKTTGFVKKETLASIVSDVSAMEQGYEKVVLKKLNKPNVNYAWAK